MARSRLRRPTRRGASRRHRRATGLEILPVRNTPLTRLLELADDQLPALLAGLGVDRIGPGRQAQRTELERFVGREGRRFVGTGAPRFAWRHQVGVRSSLHRRLSVLDHDVRPIDGPFGLDVRASALTRVNRSGLLRKTRYTECGDCRGYQNRTPCLTHAETS